MKKTFFLLCIPVLLFILSSATVWEGAAAVSSGGELPGNGLYIATNSFPLNTVVDVTNLENGLTTRATAFSNIENSPGLLALLSKDAADAIGIAGRSLGRIRITQSANQMDLSRNSQGLNVSGDPDFNPAAFVSLNSIDFSANAGAEPDPENSRTESGDLIVDLPGYEDTTYSPDYSIIPEPVPEAVETATDDNTLPDYLLNEPQSGELSLVPAETRPPEGNIALDSAYIIPEVPPVVSPAVSPVVYPQSPPAVDAAAVMIDPSLIIDSIGSSPAVNYNELLNQPSSGDPFNNTVSMQDYTPVFTPFSAPLISNLERGKYYLQIAAYSKEETVRTELSKIDQNLPVAVMNAGNSEKPVYRILIGPVNLGESGALLQRFKTSYKDAFVRLGS